jgi:hypothetical protein
MKRILLLGLFTVLLGGCVSSAYRETVNPVDRDSVPYSRLEAEAVKTYNLKVVPQVIDECSFGNDRSYSIILTEKGGSGYITDSGDRTCDRTKWKRGGDGWIRAR